MWDSADVKNVPKTWWPVGRAHASGNFTQSQFPRFHLAKKNMELPNKENIISKWWFSYGQLSTLGWHSDPCPCKLWSANLRKYMELPFVHGPMGNCPASLPSKRYPNTKFILHCSLFHLLVPPVKKICPSFCHSWKPIDVECRRNSETAITNQPRLSCFSQTVFSG